MSNNQTQEGNCIVDGSNEPFVYLYNVPNLKEIASYEVARGIWCSGLDKFQLDNERDSSHQERTEPLIKDLNIPSRIKEELQNDLLEVVRSIKQWAEDILFYMKFPKKFSKYHYDIPSIDLNWLVWSTNGEIDYLKTAKNMLQVDCLTNVHKFIIMSVYCMEDEMNKFSLDSLPAEFYADVDSSNGWVFHYWICYLRFRNERYEVSGSRTMAENFSIRDRFINEYFWSLLGDDDQVAVADYLISLVDRAEEKRKYGRYYTTCICTFFGKIISKMTRNQRRRLFAKNGTGIFVSLMCSNSPQYVLCIWRRSKNQVKVCEFASIIAELTFRSIHTAAWMSSLAEVWDTAPDLLRDCLIHLEYWLNSFIYYCLQNPYRPHVLEFLSNILIDHFSSNERKKLIFKIADSPHFSECSSESFNYLVNSCLPDIEDHLALKEFVKQSHYFKVHLHHLLICDQEYEKFNEKVQFYCSNDASAVQVFKEKFLKKELIALHSCRIGPISNIDKWNKFSEFIDDTFENDPTSRLMVKQKYVSELAAYVNLNPEWHEALRDCSDDIAKVVEMIFVDDNELKKVKRLFSHPSDPTRIKQMLLAYDRNRDRINRYYNTNPHTGQTSPFGDIDQLLLLYDRNRDRINRYLHTRMLMGKSPSGGR